MHIIVTVVHHVVGQPEVVQLHVPVVYLVHVISVLVLVMLVFVSLLTVVDVKTAAMAVAQLQREAPLIEQQKDIQRHSNLVLQCVVEMDIV